MPTPGWGPRHPRGPHPVAGYGGGELNIQNPRGTGGFFENPPGLLGGCLLVWCVAVNKSVVLSSYEAAYHTSK